MPRGVIYLYSQADEWSSGAHWPAARRCGRSISRVNNSRLEKALNHSCVSANVRSNFADRRRCESSERRCNP